MTLESCLTISIADLKKKGCFNKSRTVEVFNLTKSNGLCLSLKVEFIINDNDKYLILTHNSEAEIDKTQSYEVKLKSIPSNICGFVTYFVCPSYRKTMQKALFLWWKVSTS